MKYTGCTSYLVEDRDEDLLRAYNRIMRHNRSSLITDVYKLMKDIPASRFWVTGERAYESLVKRKRGYRIRGIKSEMYDEIERRAQAYMKENHVTFRKACKAVVLQPAPSFYLESFTIRKIISEAIKRRRKLANKMKNG